MRSLALGSTLNPNACLIQSAGIAYGAYSIQSPSFIVFTIRSGFQSLNAQGLMSYAWIAWLIIAAIFIGAEVLTPGFFLLWFGVGALAAMLLALLGVTSVAAQVIAFLVVSVALLIASRTIFERFLSSSSSAPTLKTGVEKMIGQVGTVVEPSRGALNEGAVKLYGSVWTAFPIEGEKPLAEGESVAIERVEGNSVYVRRSSRRALLFSEFSE